jgi:hypothetical protein
MTNVDPPAPGEDFACPRCRARFATQGPLEAHLVYEHHQTETQAHMEATEASTGVKIEADGRCRSCRRHEDELHAPSCVYAKKFGLPAGPTAAAAAKPGPLPVSAPEVRPEVAVPVPPPPSPASPSATKETSMPKVKVCKLCERKAPLKCKRHGGKPEKKASGGGSSKKPAVKVRGVHSNGLPSFAAAITFLDAEIADREVALTELRAARGVMARMAGADA